MTLDVRLVVPGGVDVDLFATQHFISDTTAVIAPDDSGLVTLMMHFNGADADDALRGYQAIAEALTTAERMSDSPSAAWVELRVQQHTSHAAIWIVKRGELPPTRSYVGMRQFDAELRLWVMDSRSRGASSSVTTTATLTNGAGSVMLRGVPGDDPAPVRIVLTRQGATVIRGYRIGIRPVPLGSALADWSPVVDLSPAGSAVSGADAGAVNANRNNLTLASMTVPASIAKATQPGGALQPGTYHTFVRLADVPVAPTIATPGGLAAVVTNRLLITTPDQPEQTIVTPLLQQRLQSIYATVSGGFGPGTLGASWGATTTLNSMHWAVIGIRDINGSGATANTFTVNPPAGWFSTGSPVTTGDVEQRAYVREVAPVTTGAQNWTIERATGDRTWSANLAMFELDPVSPDGSFDLLELKTFAANSITTNVTTSVDGVYLLTVLQGGIDTSNAYALWFGGWTEIRDVNGMAVAYKRMPMAGSASLSVTTVSGFESTGIILGVTPTTSTTTTPGTTIDTLDSQIPGGLPLGAGSLKVQALDAYGNVSAPSASVPFTIAREGGRLDTSWGVAVNAVGYLLSWSMLGQVRQVTVYGTAYTITDMQQGGAIAALPTAGTVTTQPSRYRLRVGTADAQYGGGYSFSTPHGASAATVYAGTHEYPPIPAHMDGVRPIWGALVDGTSGNPTDAAARVDSLWLFAAERGASFARIWALADVDVVTVYELRPDGQIAAWMQNVAGTLRYPVKALGNLYQPPGDSILTIEALGVGDATGLAFVSDLSMQFIAAISSIQRNRWLSGGG